MTATDTDCARRTALAHLDAFCTRILPGALRRIAIWKGISRQAMSDWTEDVQQELALDCLEHAGKIVELDARERHRRWMQAAERTLYRLRRRESGYESLAEEPCNPAGYDARWPAVNLPNLATLGNGRTNLIGSLRENCRGRRELRQKLDLLAAELGWDQEQQAFWQARVAEALTGLAADLLRHRRQVYVLVPPSTPPDPQRRVQRLRRLGARFPVQPSTLPVRRLLRPWRRGLRPAAAMPRRLLEQAVALAPAAAAGWLWLFEACSANDDFAAAARALRDGRATAALPKVATVLARARLLEQRGRLRAAIALLRRAAGRWSADATLLNVLKIVAQELPPARDR